MILSFKPGILNTPFFEYLQTQFVIKVKQKIFINFSLLY